MTVVRNYVEPRWWARMLNYGVSILDIYNHVPPLRWGMDAAHDSYKRVTHKPSDWFGWYEPMARCSISLGGFVWLILHVPPVRWVLSAFGYRPLKFELTIENDLACRHCEKAPDACTCLERDLYVVGTSYSVDGQPVPEEIFQETYDRSLKAHAYGWLIERAPPHKVYSRVHVTWGKPK